MTRSLAAVREPSSLELADLKLLMAREFWPDLLELLRIDLVAKHADLNTYGQIRDRAAAIPDAEIAPAPLLTGDDLVVLGISPGPRMGQVLEAVYRAQLNMQIQTREQAVTLAKSLMAG